MRLEVYPNLDGMAGTQRTIAHMRRLVEVGKVDPAVVLKAHQIVKGIDRNNWFSLGNAVFRFVHDNIDYVRDPVGVEFVKSPAITLQTKTGDCDDQAVLFAALAESIGIKTRFKAIKADKRWPHEFSHVYSQAQIPGKGWVTADTIVPKATFGWEAKDFPSQTWPATNGLSFIDRSMGIANRLGDAVLAAGSVGYDEEEDMDGGSSFGDVFGGDDDTDESLIFGGGMYDQLPVLAEDTESISTIVDADDDFWGGSTDTPAGPAMKSRMLPPGVGSLNGIQLGYMKDQHGDVWLGAYDGMGRWRPFKKLGKAISAPFKKIGAAVSKGFKQVGKEVSKGWKQLQKEATKVGNIIGGAVGLSTPQSRDAARKAAVEGSLAPVYQSDGVQIGLALLERAQDMINATKEGKIPRWQSGPPPALSGLLGEYWRIPRRTVDGMGAYVAAIQAAASILKGLGAAEDQKAAQDAVNKYVTGFPSDRLNKAIEDAAKAYIAAGGMMPSAGEKATPDWLSAWEGAARQGKSDEMTGWTYHYLNRLMTDLEATIPALTQARQLFEAAQKAFNKTEAAGTISAAANVVRLASQAGTINPQEIAAALAITKKKAQGFALTPQEQELAARIAEGARKGQGAGKGVMVALPAAAATAAAAAALLL